MWTCDREKGGALNCVNVCVFEEIEGKWRGRGNESQKFRAD